MTRAKAIARERPEIRPFMVMDVLARANAREAEGADIIHMEIGQPSAPVPDVVARAAREVLDTGRVAYSEALGRPALREAIARYYQRAHNLEIAPERVAVTTGSSGAFSLIFLGAFRPGARIGLTRPWYPAYPNILRSLDLEPVFLPTLAEEGYALDMDALEDAMRGDLDGVLIASPANPTGTVIPDADLARLARVSAETGVRIISDEIYHGLTYGGPAATMAAHDSEALIVNSFSKYYCMAGWRIGWMVLPEALVRPIERLAQNLMIAPPTLGQHAALAALSDEAQAPYRALVADYARARAMLLETLPDLGFTRLSRADGAFYVYAECSGFGMDSSTLCARLLEEAGIAATPGLDFDDVDGARTVRFSFAAGADLTARALERLQGWCKSL